MSAAPVISGAMLSYSRLEAIFFVDVVTAILAASLLLVHCGVLMAIPGAWIFFNTQFSQYQASLAEANLEMQAGD